MPLQFQSSMTDNGSERSFVLFGVLVCGIVAVLFGLEMVDEAGMLEGNLQAVEVVVQVLLMCLIGVASPRFVHEMRRRRTATLDALKSNSRIELLFKMTGMLQSALGHQDAKAVLRATAAALMPGFGGALYVFNNSGDRLELSTSWNWPEDAPLQDAISPSDCWAIKRGKLHLNLAGDDALCCDHHHPGLVAMDIPMMARGEVYGLLMVQQDGATAAEDVELITEVAIALADAMSLSLSNLALRERLRTQALRDALTGLYNRRYIEDALERCADLAGRTKSPLSVVMIDLDHFKKINDEHGHAMGDTLLAETASAILGAIRPCDIACRYGGEELVVLLPDCTLEEAGNKAEMLRMRIERLSDRHGIPLSASFGIATIPETSTLRDVMSDADRALYRAKQDGRNRVVPAPPSTRDFAGRLASKAA